MAKRATKRASKKEYTLSEFKAWLEGIEELQPANWAPDASQWKTIRDKLMNIVEEEVVVEVPAPAAVQPQQVTQPAGPALIRQAPTGPTAGWGNAPAAPPVEGSALPAAQPEMTPAAAAALNGKLPSEMVPASDGKLKTSNIDTSDGNYGSSFE